MGFGRILGAAMCAVLPAIVIASSLPASAVNAQPPVVTVEVAEADAIPEQARALVAEMTVAQQAASVVMGHISTTDAAALRDYMGTAELGGFILMGSNVPADEAGVRQVTQALASSAEPAPLIAIDQEGGVVSRLTWDTFPSPSTLKNAAVTDTAAAYAARSALVDRAGANVNFGIVADVTADTGSFIYPRALGATPDAAAERVAAAVTAEEPLVASTLKHFPGHGAAPGDSHRLIPSTDKTLAQWRETDAKPFAAGMEAGASLLMFGHLSYTAVDPLPATLSPRWYEIARDELGFDGVIVTDDLGMLQSSGNAAFADPVKNAVTAIAAGADLVLTVVSSTAVTAPAQAAGIAAAVESGVIPAERLEEAATRVMSLRLQQSTQDASWTLCADCEPVG